MMKKYFLIILGAALLLAACAEQQYNNDRPQAGEIILTARTEQPDSKSVVTDETKVFWEPGDEIVVFAGEKSGKFANELTEPAATAKFKGSIGEETGKEEFWALYPYSEDATFDGESITTVLPSVQEARAGSFAKDMNLAVAHSDNNTLQFFNVGGGVRFSVTEEGIEKVIFEGLDGEVLAGKVKIGFENGIPKVQEVTSGSIFLTLLPPDGETFQKDKWYFIVALPGALEKGYKMRFYKGDDYARRISESPVTIKRSIYGTVADADAGISYEAIITHLPSTEEERTESINTSEEISSKMTAIIAGFNNEENDDVDALCDEIELIDGVDCVKCNDDKTVISVKQKDQIWINHLMTSRLNIGNYSDEASDVTTKALLQNTNPGSSGNRTLSLSTGKKALILSPFQSKWNSNLDTREDLLKQMGYSVTVKPNKDADYYAFTGDDMDGYDFIFINTHGDILSKVSSGEKVTTFMTATQYSEMWLNHLDTETFAIGHTDEDPTNYIFVTPEALGDCSLDGAIIQTSVCYSLAIREGSASMAQAFIDHKATAYLGFTESVNRGLAEKLTLFQLRFFSEGISFQKTASYWATSHLLESACKAHNKYFNDNITHRIFSIKQKNENSDFYLCDATPYLISSQPFEGKIKLKWASTLYPTDTRIKWAELDANGNLVAPIFDGVSHFGVYYDVIIDGKGLITQTESEYNYIPTSSGNHSWQIIAHFRDTDTGYDIESFESEIGYFYVEEEKYETPSLVDLGLPSKVKWATFNLGATKPEEPGKFFAWGETEPKSDNTWSTYKWCKGTNTTITKYCWDSSYGYNGFTDNKKELDQEDDAAYAKLKGQFRTPTVDDWREMLENTTHTWTNNYNGTGVAGLVCKSTVSGYTSKSIFLPAAKYGSCGDYMTASAVNTSPDGFDVVYFTENELYGANYDHKCSAGARCEGSTIRPVSGQVTKTAIISLEADRYDFGTLALKSQKRVSLNITNTGNKDLEITSIKMVSGKKGFQLANTVTPPVTISPNYSITIEFRFYPTTKGYATDKIQIESNAANMSTAYITLTGTGE